MEHIKITSDFVCAVLVAVFVVDPVLTYAFNEVSSWFPSYPVVGELPPLLDLCLKETNPSEELLNSPAEKAFFGVSPENHEIAKSKGYRNTFPLESESKETFQYVKASGILILADHFTSSYPGVFISSRVNTYEIRGYLSEEFHDQFFPHFLAENVRIDFGVYGTTEFAYARLRWDFNLGNLYAYASLDGEEIKEIRELERPPEPSRWRRPIIGDTRLGQPRREIHFLPEGEPIPAPLNDGIIREYVRVPHREGPPVPRYVRPPPRYMHIDEHRCLKVGVGIEFLKIPYLTMKAGFCLQHLFPSTEQPYPWYNCELGLDWDLSKNLRFSYRVDVLRIRPRFGLTYHVT